MDRNAPPLQLKDEKKEADETPDEDKVKSDSAGSPAVREDWWLVRDPQMRVGWVLGRALYLQLPEEIAQYSEGQRIVAAYRSTKSRMAATRKFLSTWCCSRKKKG